MFSDLRYAFRRLARTPGFTLIAVCTLALGIGASAALFSALRALVLAPLPYERADQLVHVWSGPRWPLSTPDYFDIREQASSFSEFGIYIPSRANIGGGEKPQNVPAVSCTSGVLRALSVQPLHGRLIEADDEVPGALPVAVMAHSIWRTTFASDLGIVGRSIRLNGRSVTVVGIMPASFEFAAPWMRGMTCQLWTPLQMRRGDGNRGNHWLCALARLKPGVAVGAAEAEIKAIGKQLTAAHPGTNTGKEFLVTTLQEEMAGPMRMGTWMVFGAVLLLQLIACANVASMLLARSALRQSELGLRTAIGATRRDIARLILAESFLLALGASLLAVLVADLSVGLVSATMPVSHARKTAIALGSGEFLFIAALASLTTLIAGVPTILASTRNNIVGILRAGTRTATGAHTRHHSLRTLVVAQIVIAFLLVNSAVLFSSSYRNMGEANKALSSEFVLSASVSLQGDRYTDIKARTLFSDQFIEAARSIPGVISAATTSKLPLEGGSNTTILANDEVADPTAKRPLIEVSTITPEYFSAAGIKILRGRTLRPEDNGSGQHAGVVVNRTFAEKYWPNQDPIGQLIRQNSEKPDWTATVVGVVEDVRQWGATTDPQPEIYWGLGRGWNMSNVVFLLVRSQQPAEQLTEALQKAVAAIDPDLPLSHVRTLKRLIYDATAGFRPVVWYVNAFMALALLLVAIGLYGTLSYLTRERIRLALGASRQEIRRIVIGQGLRWALLGSAIGIAGAFALSSVLRSMLFGIGAINLPALLAGLGLACAVSVFACWLPARRATRVDPMVALRSE